MAQEKSKVINKIKSNKEEIKLDLRLYFCKVRKPCKFNLKPSLEKVVTYMNSLRCVWVSRKSVVAEYSDTWVGR